MTLDHIDRQYILDAIKHEARQGRYENAQRYVWAAEYYCGASVAQEARELCASLEQRCICH